MSGDCELMACGHSHRVLTRTPARKLALFSNSHHSSLNQHYLNPQEKAGKYIDHDLRWYVCSGSFLKQFVEGIDGYAERCGYEPIEIGYVIVHIRNGAIVDLTEVII